MKIETKYSKIRLLGTLEVYTEVTSMNVQINIYLKSFVYLQNIVYS